MGIIRMDPALLAAALFLTGPARVFAQAPVGQSLYPNTMNPAIGLGGLLLGTYAPDAAQGSFAESAEVPGGFVDAPGAPHAFALQEAELAINSFVDPYWTFTANVVIAADEVAPEEVFAVTTRVPDVSFKAGKFKTAFGKHGLLHVHAFPFIAPALILPATIGEEGYNDAGVEAAWLSPLPWFAELTLGSYSGSSDGGLDLASPRPDDFAYLARVRNYLDLTESASVELGASGLAGRGSDSNTHAAYGVDITYRSLPPTERARRSWVVQGEWIEKTARPHGGPLVKQTQGWYGSVQYRFAPGWWLGARVEQVLRVPDAGYAHRETVPGTVDTEPIGGAGLHDPVQGGVRRATIGLIWATSEFSALRLDYRHAIARVGGSEEPDRRVMLQLNQFVGAHPAHAF